MSKLVNILCIILVLSFMGCSKKEEQQKLSDGETQTQTQPSSDSQGNLTRDIAAKLFIAQYGASTHHTCTISYHTESRYWDDIEIMKKYQKAGLVIFEESSGNATLTPEGKKYVVSEDNEGPKVRDYDIYFNKITGMLPVEEPGGVKTVQVDYELVYKNTTPFNVDSNAIYAKKEGGVSKGQATFVLYDDGWRIKKANGLW